MINLLSYEKDSPEILVCKPITLQQITMKKLKKSGCLYLNLLSYVLALTYHVSSFFFDIAEDCGKTKNELTYETIKSLCGGE